MCCFSVDILPDRVSRLEMSFKMTKNRRLPSQLGNKNVTIHIPQIQN